MATEKTTVRDAAMRTAKAEYVTEDYVSINPAQNQSSNRVADALRRFPLPSQSASASENYRRILEWLYRENTDRLICDLVLEEAHRA